MTGGVSYPSLGQALLLALAVIVLQVVIGVTIGVVLPSWGITLPMAAAIGFANLLTFGLVIWWAVWRSGLRSPVVASGGPSMCLSSC
jgi:hypothetical protein